MMSHTASSPAGAVGSDDVGSDEVQEFVAEHPNLVRFSRVGWVAKGIVYSLVGVLALTVAVGGRNDTTPEGEASQTGAIREDRRGLVRHHRADHHRRRARALRPLAHRDHRPAGQERRAHVDDARWATP